MIRGNTGAAYLKNVGFYYFTGVGADFSGAAGMDIVGCSFYANPIGLKLPGHCDGAAVEARVDRNDIVVEVGAPDTAGYFGYHGINGCRVHLVGARNIYGVVVGLGSGPIDTTGYMEQCYSAVLAVGHPPDFYPGIYTETNSYRRRVNCRLGYGGQMSIPFTYDTATGTGGASGPREGGGCAGKISRGR